MSCLASQLLAQTVSAQESWDSFISQSEWHIATWAITLEVSCLGHVHTDLFLQVGERAIWQRGLSMHKSKHDLFMCKTNNDYTRQIHSTLQSRFGGAQHWTFWACSL